MDLMDGWTGIWMDGRINEWMDGWMDGWMTGGWMDGWMNEWMNGWDGWMEGWMNPGNADRLVDIVTWETSTT